VEKPALKI